MPEENKVEASVDSPFDKEGGGSTGAPNQSAEVEKAEVIPTEEVATPEVATSGDTETPAPEVASTPASVDYAKYAEMAETPSANERRKFDYVAMSGSVETEVVTTDQGEFEQRKPAIAFKLFLTKDRDTNDQVQSEEIALPLTVVPIKYRMVMEQRAGAKGEILVLKSSEFNGKTTDLVTVNRFSPEGKVVQTYGPMTSLEARNKFVDADDKKLLRDKAHVYSMVGEDLVRFVVKGTGLWEMESDLHKGKTPASQAKHPFLKNYLSEFAIDNPYFLYEMEVNAVYRDHGSIKYYRPTFTKGARITQAVEDVVLAHLEDLYKYFAEMDEETKAFVPTTAPVAPVAEEAPVLTTPTGTAPAEDGEY